VALGADKGVPGHEVGPPGGDDAVVGGCGGIGYREMA
jgi:hypothetical protein